MCYAHLMKSCDICAIIPDIKPEYMLYEGVHWLANLRERDQTLLGTSFITARRHVPKLYLLTDDEESEFRTIRNTVMRATETAFSPVNVNVSCLMNDALAQDPSNASPDDTHVHWHIKPRYGTQPVEFAGETFLDPAPGRYLAAFERHRPSLETAAAIASAIRSHIDL